ncbi:MAG: hypothetical protein R6V49_08140 [Bacteroidales bacterium]
MDNLRHIIFRMIFPAVLLLAGIAVLIFGFANDQSVYFLLGGTGVVIVGILTLLIMIGYEKIPLAVYKYMMIFLIPAIIVMFFWSFRSINEPIKFENEYQRRAEVVKERLIHIRDAQEAFKSVNKRYTSDFDTLVDFIKNGNLTLLKKINNTPTLLRDSLPERELIKRGYIIIDTTYKSVMDSIFKNVYNFSPDKLPYIPFSEPRQRFSMQADFITRSGILVPVFEVVADKFIYLNGLNETYIKMDKVISLQVGSLTEPIKDGNWE